VFIALSVVEMRIKLKVPQKVATKDIEVAIEFRIK